MPPKRNATGSAAIRKSTRPTKAAESAVNGTHSSDTEGVAKTTKNAPVSSKATKATKTNKPTAKESAKKSNKRKAEDDVDEVKAKDKKIPKTGLPKDPETKSNKRKAEDDDELMVNGEKTTTVTDDDDSSAEKATKKTKRTAAVKAPPAKKQKKIVVINEAPTDKLNVYVFGDGTNGELGLGTGKNCAEVKRPRLNPHLNADGVGVVSVSVGGMHTAVLTQDNKILTWGVNDQGALGRNTEWEGGLRDISEDKSGDDDSDSDSDTGGGLNPKESTPGEVDLSGVPEDTVFTQLVCSDSATFALTNDGLVYGCGTFRVSLIFSMIKIKVMVLMGSSQTKASSALRKKF